MFEQIVKVGVNVILVDNGKVLLGLRKNIVGEGTWGVPGGHLEFGEIALSCAQREVFEETGLITDALEFVGINNQPQANLNRHYVQIIYVSKKFHGSLENKEPDKCERWEWFDNHRLPSPIFHAHKDFIADYLNHRVMRDESLIFQL